MPEILSFATAVHRTRLHAAMQGAAVQWPVLMHCRIASANAWYVAVRLRMRKMNTGVDKPGRYALVARGILEGMRPSRHAVRMLDSKPI